MENIFGLNSPHEKEDDNLVIKSSKTDDDSKEMPKKVAKPSRKPGKKENGKSQLPINDRPRRQMKRKIPENEGANRLDEEAEETETEVEAEPDVEVQPEIEVELEPEVEPRRRVGARAAATAARSSLKEPTLSSKLRQGDCASNSKPKEITVGTTKKKNNNKALKTDEIAQMLNSDDEEAVEVAQAKKRATSKKVQKQMVSTSCTAKTVLKHGTEDSLKTAEIAQMLNDDEEGEGE